MTYLLMEPLISQQVDRILGGIPTVYNGFKMTNFTKRNVQSIPFLALNQMRWETKFLHFYKFLGSPIK